MSQSKPKLVRITTDSIVVSLFHYLKEEFLFLKANNDEKCDFSYLSNITKRTAEATGVSEQTVQLLIEEDLRIKQKPKSKKLLDEVWPLPSKKPRLETEKGTQVIN